MAPDWPADVAVVAADDVGPVPAIEPTSNLTTGDGAEIAFDERPERIVCVTGACDDMLFSMGLIPVATSTPALLSLPSYLGDEASDIDVVPGSFGAEDVEAIAAAEPDLVIGLAGVHEGLAEPLEPYAPVWTVRVSSHEDSVLHLRSLAAVLDRTTEAETVEREFRQALADARATSERYGLNNITALTMYSSGAGTGVNTEDDLLGGLTAEIFRYPWPSRSGDVTTAGAYAIEEILEKDPAIVFLQSFGARDGSAASDELATDPAWSRISAVQQDRVVEVLTPLWTTGRGPHALTLVLREMIDAVAHH